MPFSVQKICFRFLLSVFGAHLDSLGIVCDQAGWSDGGVAVGTYKKGKGESNLLTCH